MEKRTVRAVRRVGRAETTYNVRVADNHNYFANGVLVHNCDDPNNVKDQSDVRLDDALSFFTQVLPSRFNDPQTGRLVVVQQRTHERDISGYIMSNLSEDYVKLILPMEFESKRRCVTVPLPSTKGKPWRDPRKKEGDLLHPNQVPLDALQRLKRTIGSSYAIAGQLQQRPAPEEGGMIKKRWFRIWDQERPPALEYTVLSIDPAMSEASDASYSAATCWGVFNHVDEKNEFGAAVGDGGVPNTVPNVILLSTWRARCEYPELRARLRRMADDYLDDGPEPRNANKRRAPDMMLLEAKASGISLIQDLRRAGIPVAKFNPDRLGDKKQRVRLITPLLESGRVWLPGRPPDYKELRPYADEFREQASMFPAASSRDLVDTMTQALWRLMSSGFVWNPQDPGPEEPMDRGQAEAFY